MMTDFGNAFNCTNITDYLLLRPIGYILIQIGLK